MTKKQFDKIFKEEYSDLIKECKRTGDKAMLRTAYNDFTDYACKLGMITEKQYNEFTCPIKWAYED